MKSDVLEQNRKLIIRYILDNGLSVGNHLPSIRQLQAIFLLSKYAVMDVLNDLCKKGIIEKGASARNGYHIVSMPDAAAAGEPGYGLMVQFVLPFNRWNYVGNQLLSKVEHAFSSQNCNLIFSNNTNSPAVEHQLLQNLIASPTSNKADALLLMSSCSNDNPTVELLKMIQQKMPVILVDRTINGFDSFYVGLNNRYAGQHAVNRLWDAGHRTFAFVGGFSSISPVQDRMLGFSYALDAKNVPARNRHSVMEQDLDRGGYSQIKEQVSLIGEKLLKAKPRPTAIVCSSDRIATCLVDYYYNRGLSFPDDIAIIGCDNDKEFSPLCPLPLTTYSHPYREMADAIFRLTFELYDKPFTPYRQIEFTPKFMSGKTG